MYVQISYANYRATVIAAVADSSTVTELVPTDTDDVANKLGNRFAVEIINNTADTIYIGQSSATAAGAVPDPALTITSGYPLSMGSSKIYGGQPSVRYYVVCKGAGSIRFEEMF